MDISGWPEPMFPNNKAFDVAEEVVNFICANGAECTVLEVSTSSGGIPTYAWWILGFVGIFTLLCCLWKLATINEDPKG